MRFCRTSASAYFSSLLRSLIEDSLGSLRLALLAEASRLRKFLRQQEQVIGWSLDA